MRDMRLAGRLLALAAPEKRPGDPENWRAFSRFVAEVEAFLTSWHLEGPLAAAYPGVVPSITGFAKRGWCASWERYAAGYRLTRSLADTRDLRDSVQRVATRWGVDLVPRAAAVMLSMDMEALQHLSEHWHRAVRAATEACKEERAAEEPTWEPLLPDRLSWEGFEFVALTSPHALRKEGFRMGHCVSLYAERCLVGRTHILSIRNGRDDSWSTLEIELTESAGRYEPVLRQHAGPRNQRPPVECQQAVQFLLERLREPEMQAWFKVLEIARLGRQSWAIEWIRGAGAADARAELKALEEALPWVYEWLPGMA